jgi:8-oxo-dGTP diphosphatase
MTRAPIRVTAALLADAQGRLLVARRGPGRHLAGFWEFPGGKVEPEEEPEACLARELFEELGITCHVRGFRASSVHTDERATIELLAYEVAWTGGELVLRDHDAVDWVEPARLPDLALAPADVSIARLLAEEARRA